MTTAVVVKEGGKRGGEKERVGKRESQRTRKPFRVDLLDRLLSLVFVVEPGVDVANEMVSHVVAHMHL